MPLELSQLLTRKSRIVGSVFNGTITLLTPVVLPGNSKRVGLWINATNDTLIAFEQAGGINHQIAVSGNNFYLDRYQLGNILTLPVSILISVGQATIIEVTSDEEFT